MCYREYRFELCPTTVEKINALTCLLHAPPWTTRRPMLEPNADDGHVIFSVRFASQAHHDDFFNTVNGRAARRTMTSLLGVSESPTN